MAKSKWIMKQYWRVGTIRTTFSLALGMLVLGRLYYIYIPGLSDKGLVGALVLGSALILLFLGLGWLYDEKAKMWNQQIQASTERNPYVYISNYKSEAFDYPAFYGFLLVMKRITEKLGLEVESAGEILKYMDQFYKRTTSRRDVFSALPDATEYIERHPFVADEEVEDEPRIGLRSRAKLSFQIHLLRLTWIQSLTGLFQDVLVFGALYVVLFVAGSQDVVGTIVPIDILILGILFLSLPLFVFLASLGWLYDKKLRIWSPDIVVKVERNPFTYVAEPYLYIMVFPVLIVVFNVLRKAMIEADVDTAGVDKVLSYFDEYSRFDVSRDEDMQEARKLRSVMGDLFTDNREAE